MSLKNKRKKRKPVLLPTVVVPPPPPSHTTAVAEALHVEHGAWSEQLRAWAASDKPTLAIDLAEHKTWAERREARARILATARRLGIVLVPEAEAVSHRGQYLVLTRTVPSKEPVKRED